MDVEVLNHFLTVVREENISRAAERLHVSVDTVKRLRRSAYRKLQDEIYTTR